MPDVTCIKAKIVLIDIAIFHAKRVLVGTGTGKHYVSYNTITGTLTNGSTGTNGQYSTRSSYSGGERNADKLCETQRKAATGVDTSVYDGSCDVEGNGAGIYILECETVVHCK